MVKVLFKCRGKRQSAVGGKVFIFLLGVLLCFAMLTGCKGGQDNGNGTPTGSIVAATSTPTATPAVTGGPTPTPTATPFPTLPIEFARKTYETYECENLYRIPIEGLEDQKTLKDVKFAGEYALLQIAPKDVPDEAGSDGKSESSAGTAGNSFLLIRPEITADRYLLTPDYDVAAFTVLSDGTVIIEDSSTKTFRVYDNTMTEVRTVTAVSRSAKTIGFGEDGTAWAVDLKQAKIVATGPQGEAIGEYPHAKGQVVTGYIGNIGGRECFLTTSSTDSALEGYLYIDTATGELTQRSVDDPELGDEWIRNPAMPNGEWDFQWSDAMWYLHAPGYCREGFVFPKSAEMEVFCVSAKNQMCACEQRWDGDDVIAHTYRLYDMNRRTVSGTLCDEDLTDCAKLTPKGIVGNSVLFSIKLESGGEAVLLWTAGAETSPITGFCDLTKDEPATVLAEQLAEMKEQYNIVITPDRAQDGEEVPLRKTLVQMETADVYLIAARRNPDVVTNTAGTVIQPENMRNNDGGHYTFNPHVMSPFLAKEYAGATETFFAYIDALRAGEDSFPCPDEETMQRCEYQLARYCGLVAQEYAFSEYEGDGRAKVIYRVSKEEYQKKEKDFEERICAILNDVLEDDYTDLEKALALYEYITEYCRYDDDKLFSSMNGERISQTGYRVLLDGKGMCWEIASLYAYLLMQSGVDADVVTCVGEELSVEGHAWVYMELDGQGYLIDPTWGLTDYRRPSLTYFLFTDELRESRDGYPKKLAQVAEAGAGVSRTKYSFDADDSSYSEIWDGWFIGFDHDTKSIYYEDSYGILHRFDYGQ